MSSRHIGLVQMTNICHKMDKHTLIPGLGMTFFFGFNNAQLVRILVQDSGGELFTISNSHPQD